MKVGKMFKNHYQGGQFVEIFSAQGKNPGAKWKILGNPSAISKEYDKELKGFVFVLQGNSLTNKMKLPKETRQTLGLIQQFLTLQIFVPLGEDFSTELLSHVKGQSNKINRIRHVENRDQIPSTKPKPRFAFHGHSVGTGRELMVKSFIKRKTLSFEDQVNLTNEASLQQITDLGNIKRRLYLSTVHKELSVTPLHAKIPLFMIKRKIWCNMCIDLVALTSEIFRGAEFRSLDGIIISANCKLRKIFTLKSKPQDTAEGDGTCGAPSRPCEPTDGIPQTCRLNSDVPQVTQLLNLTKIKKPEIKCKEDTAQETGSSVNRGQGKIRSSKTQDVSHIAFGSRILGPPPSSNRKANTKTSGKVTKTSASNTSCQLQNSGTPTESTPDIERLELSVSPCSDTLDQGGKNNTLQTAANVYQNDLEIQIQKTSVSGEADFQLTSPQVPSPDESSHRRLSLKNSAETTWEITSDREVSPWRFTESIQLGREEHFGAAGGSPCRDLPSAHSASGEHHRRETAHHRSNEREVFTFSSRPRSAPHGKSPNMSPQSCVFPLDLEPDSNGEHEKSETEDSFEGTDSSEEDDNSELIQSTESVESSRSRQGTSYSAVFKEIPLNKMSQRNEYWKNKEHSKQNFEETELSKPQSSTMRKTESISFQRSLKPILSLSPIQSKSKSFRVIRNVSEGAERYEGVLDQLERSVSKTSLKKVSKENSCLTAQTREYDRKKYQANRLSSSELQMLASKKRQQNEELRNAGISQGLSTSKINSCNVSISTSRDDDTETWNSCFPPPISQEHHYQKEMSPLSHSNLRDWLSVFSPPIIPGSQQLEEHTKSSTEQST